MKKDKKPTKRPLNLAKQTVKALGDRELKQAIGGTCLEIREEA